MKKNMFAGADANLFARANSLRKRQTHAEETLWLYLRQKPLGYKFRRQHPFGIYILDFFCYKLNLIIEVDGSVHNDPQVKANDEYRATILK